MADLFSDSYRVISAHSRAESVVLASRFIADVFPVNDETAAQSALDVVRKEFHAATHHCWAWRIGAEQPRARSSDDGEPSGSAGRPILHALERSDVTNALLVVTRYFGGTKLGVGGLARAYGDAADAVMKNAAVETRTITETFTVTTTYDALPRVKSLVYKHASLVAEEFGDAPQITVSVSRSGAARLKAAIIDAARGQATIADE